jgi:hypothetical protein
MSFSVKSTHSFVNPKATTPKPQELNEDLNNLLGLDNERKSNTFHQHVAQNSQQDPPPPNVVPSSAGAKTGISIKSNYTSCEDFY